MPLTLTSSFRVAVVIAVALSTSPSPVMHASAQGAQGSGDSTVWRNKPATPARMVERINAAAEQYKAEGPIPRVALYDIGFPRTIEEYHQLDGHAVLLITALSQERDELPLARVYVRSASGSEVVELRPLNSVRSDQSGVTSNAVKTFGAFRVDGLYLLPAHLRLMPGDLLVDFSKNRVGLRVATFGTPVSPEVEALHIEPPKGSGPDPGALSAFVAREFPGFSE